MMFRSTARQSLAAFVLTVGLGLGATTGTARAAEVIRMGTLVPAASPWGHVFKVWADAVSKRTGGAVELQFFFNGTQGDEAAMVGKIKDGGLDGAAVTAVGLGKIYKPILALQMPGLFTTWSKLDAALNATKGTLEQGAKEAGVDIVGRRGAPDLKGLRREDARRLERKEAAPVARRRHAADPLRRDWGRDAGVAQRAGGAAPPQHRGGQCRGGALARRRAAPVGE
jgi:hypothetical protein